MSDIAKLLGHATDSARFARHWGKTLDANSYLNPDEQREAAKVILGCASDMDAMAGEIRRLVAKLEIARQLIDVLRVRDDSCVDHPVLDFIAVIIGAEFAIGRPADIGPAENVARESESVTFLDKTDGQRYEIVVRPIEEKEPT